MIVATAAVTVSVLAIAALVYQLTAAPADDKPPPSAPLLPIAFGSNPITIPPTAMDVPDAELDVAEIDAMPEASLPNLPPGCSPTSTTCECCPSSSDCGGACEDLLEADEKFHLRLGAVVPREAAALSGVMVCARAQRSPGKSCTHASTVLDGAIPSTKLFVDTSDFLLGIEFDVFGAPTSAASVARAGIKEHPKRLALCQGIEVSFSEGPIEKARFYLDSPELQSSHRCRTQ